MAATDRMQALLLALFQFLAFDLAWAAAVAGGAGGWPWLGSMPAVLVLGLHLFLARRWFKAELVLVLAILLFGVVLEAGFMAAGLIRYAGTAPDQLLPPVWIWALWTGFASLPNGSLTWLRGRFLLQAALGAAFGPLAYWTGGKLGAAELAPGALAVIGLAWALAFPTLMLLAETLSPRASGHS